MTPEAKLILHKMLYYQLVNNTVLHPMKCYILARDKANYILAAIGEKLDE